MKKYNVTPATNRQVTEFYKKQNNNSLEWSAVLLQNILQVCNGKSNTQQINKSLNLETTRFKNGRLKQQGQSILAYLLHIVESHDIGIKWKDDRFQFLESITLDIESVIPYHVWIAEAEEKAEKEKQDKEKEKQEAEAEAKRLQDEEKAAKAAKKSAEKAAKKAAAEAEAAKKAAAEAKDKAEAEAAKKAEAEALQIVKVETKKAEEAEAEAEAKAKEVKAERDRLIAAGAGVKAASLLVQLEKALLAGIVGGSVSQLQAIADAAKELQIMATGLAVEEQAKVDAAAALQLAEVKPSAKSRSAGLKKVG